MRYYLYSLPTDMRRSFYTLSGMVTNLMGRNVQDGDVFIFVNRTCTSMKVLHMECGGLVIYHMKLVNKILLVLKYYFVTMKGWYRVEKIM